MKRELVCAAAMMLAVGCAQGEDDGTVGGEAAITGASPTADFDGRETADPSSPTGKSFTDGPELKMEIGGQQVTLKNAGAGVRMATPGVWKEYLSPDDTLADKRTLSGIKDTEGSVELIPVYYISVFVSDPDKLVREDASPSAFDNPWLNSLAAQKYVVFRLSEVRMFDVDIFVQGVRNKFKANSFPIETDATLHDIRPQDRTARLQVANAYQKIGWFDKGEGVDFIFEHGPNNTTRVTQKLHVTRRDKKIDRILYPTEAPGRKPYAEGSEDLAKEVMAVWFGAKDNADPGIMVARKTIINGDTKVTGWL